MNIILDVRYEMTPVPLDVGTRFRFIFYNFKTKATSGDCCKAVQSWCIDNIRDDSYHIEQTMLGCWVTVYDDEYAVAFKLRWL